MVDVNLKEVPGHEPNPDWIARFFNDVQGRILITVDFHGRRRGRAGADRPCIGARRLLLHCRPRLAGTRVGPPGADQCPGSARAPLSDLCRVPVLAPGGRSFERRPLALLEPDANGETDVGPLNEGFDAVYLGDPRNPCWVAKPTVACLWARTVRYKSCRATMSLFKTRWLCKKDNKRVLLTMTPNAEKAARDGWARR